MEWTELSLRALWGWLGCALLMLALWTMQLRTRNAGIVDVGWAVCLAGLAVFVALVSDGWWGRRLLVGVLAGIWGMRLAWHLLTDRILGRPEEGRYVTLRQRWSAHSNLAFLVFFQAQALLAVLLSLPFLLATASRVPGMTVFDGLGSTLWLIGILGESIADRQLASWKRQPAHRGRTCRSGLWRYSRHPNYFFEWLIWCGYGVLALSSPWGWLGFSAPLLILYFVLFVTGIPPTEAQALRSRGEDYIRYQQTTSPFFPWFPGEEQ